MEIKEMRIVPPRGHGVGYVSGREALGILSQRRKG
jgi:hypothetical protein